MIKLIASDLDGTLLLDGAQTLNPEVYDLIIQLKEKGIRFVAASGRQLASQHKLFEPIKEEIDYVAENGGVYSYNGESFPTTEIPRDLAFRITDAIAAIPGCRTVVSCMESCYILEGDPLFAYHLVHTMNNVTTEVASFRDITTPILKIAFFIQENVHAVAKQLSEQFQEEIKVVTSGNEWIDFIPFDTNKAAALSILMKRYGVTSQEVIAFGDQENDLEMLALAGTSYAMSSAKDMVKAHANKIATRVEDELKNILKGM